MAEDAAALVGHGDAAELLPDHVGHAVVAGDPLVDEGVVGGEQVEDAAVLAHQAVEEELGLADAGSRARVWS